MDYSRAVSVLYMLDPVGWLILEPLVSSTSGACRMPHSRAVGVLHLLELVGYLILGLLVSSTS